MADEKDELLGERPATPETQDTAGETLRSSTDEANVEPNSDSGTQMKAAASSDKADGYAAVAANPSESSVEVAAAPQTVQSANSGATAKDDEVGATRVAAVDALAGSAVTTGAAEEVFEDAANVSPKPATSIASDAAKESLSDTKKFDGAAASAGDFNRAHVGSASVSSARANGNSKVAGSRQQPMRVDLDKPGLGLLYDVELDATLQFGSKEMLLRDVLELGPGDVVELDRHIAEPVDLVVGDRIVARGEVVVASGNFALRVTEVATPQMRLESIRCLF